MQDRSRKKRPRDPSQFGKLIVDISVGEVEDIADAKPIDATKDPAAVSLGRRGGLKGGRARATKLPVEERRAIAARAAAARWSKREK